MNSIFTHDSYKTGRKVIQQKKVSQLNPPLQMKNEDIIKIQGSTNDSICQQTQLKFYNGQKCQDLFEGYKISVQIPKEKSFDENQKEKFIDFINKFFFNGHFEMSVSLPHIFSEQQIQDFRERYQDLNFQLKKVEFEEEDYQFYQRIYQFKGQQKPKISQRTQMLIYDNFIFQKLISQAKAKGLNFTYDYQTAQCSVITPNTTFHDPKLAMKFFTNNVLNLLNNYEILEIETESQEECLTKSKLIKSLHQKLETHLDTKIELIYVQLQELKLQENWNNWFKQELQSNKLYLVYEKKDLDSQTMNADLNKFIKDNIKKKSIQFSIEMDEPPEDDFTQQQESLQKNYKYISIEIDKPKKKNQDKLIVEITLTAWHKTASNLNTINNNFEEIKKDLNSIYKPFYIIKIQNQDQVPIWVDYLKNMLTPEEAQQIQDDQQQLNSSQFQGNQTFGSYTIKISTFFQDYEKLGQKINQQLLQLQINTFQIKIENQILSLALKDQAIESNAFSKILNSFQSNYQEKILQIIIEEHNHLEFKFKVISDKKVQKKEIEEIIKMRFINQLQVLEINFRVDLNILKKDLPSHLTDGQIVVLQYNGKTQNLIAKKQQIEELKTYLKQIENNILEQTIQIRLTIQNNQQGNELKAKLKDLLSCISTYNQETCLFTIELLKQDFENVIQTLKEFAKQYEKINICDDKQILKCVNQDYNCFKEIEKNEKVIISLQKLKTYDPLNSTLSIIVSENKRINLVRGQISEIQCQAIVLQFVKNFNYSNLNLQDNQIKNILMQTDNKQQLQQSWKKQMEQGNEIPDMKFVELSKTNDIKYLFQIYPLFYNSCNSLKKHLIHIQDLIKEVFKQAKQIQINQIAFPLIGVELFGYSVKAIQQVLVQQIVFELSQKDCSVDQVFVVDDCEIYLNQLYEYFKSFQEQKRPDSAYRRKQVNQSQIAQWQKEKGGFLIDIEEPEVNELISNKYQLQSQGQKIEPFLITYPYSKYPGTHIVDMKQKKITNQKTKKEQRIDFIELFQQRLYFFDYQQVDASLNRFLLVRHEQSQQEEFDLFYTQDQVISENLQFFIQNKGGDEKRKIVCSGKLSERQDWIEPDFLARKQTNFIYQNILVNPKQHQPKLQICQIEISSDSDTKNGKALEQIKKIQQRKISQGIKSNQNLIQA